MSSVPTGIEVAESLCESILQTVRRCVAAQELPAHFELVAMEVALARAQDELAAATFIPPPRTTGEAATKSSSGIAEASAMADELEAVIRAGIGDKDERVLWGAHRLAGNLCARLLALANGGAA